MEELIPIFLFLVVGGVLVLRPLTKKMGLLIEALAKERISRLQTGGNGGGHDVGEAQMIRITAALERLHSRMDNFDDRIGFVERLVEDRPRSRLTG